MPVKERNSFNILKILKGADKNWQEPMVGVGFGDYPGIALNFYTFSFSMLTCRKYFISFAKTWPPIHSWLMMMNVVLYFKENCRVLGKLNFMLQLQWNLLP